MRSKKNMSLVKLMKEVMLSEGDTSGSTDAENVLAILMSNQNMTKEEFATFYKSRVKDSVFLKNYFGRFLKGNAVEVYYGAILEIKKEKLPSNAKQVGDSNFPTTDIWKAYGGIGSVRSKADVIGQGITFSVKNASTKVRVLDASAPQIIALIHCAMDKTKQDIKVKEIVRKSVATLKELSNAEGAKLSRMFDNKKYGLGELRKVVNTTMQELIADYDKNTKDMNDQIIKIFDSIQGDAAFKKAFIYESLSGKTMLGRDSEGRADSILTWTADFSTIKNHTVKDVTDKVVSSFTIPKFGSKSSGVRITKTVQLFMENELKKFDKLVLEERKLYNNRKSRLISEGAFSDLWNSIQEKGMAIIKKIINGVMNFLKEVTAKLSLPLNNLLKFLGVDIQILSDYSVDASVTYGSL